jgi:hypothetical protein
MTQRPVLPPPNPNVTRPSRSPLLTGRARQLAAVAVVLVGIVVAALGAVPLTLRLVELLGGSRVYLELALMSVGAGIAGYGAVGIDVDGGTERKGTRR